MMKTNRNRVVCWATAGVILAACTPAHAALVSHYALEGNAIDSQGVQDGVINGGPATVAGKIGNAISFNAGVADANLRTQNMTVADPGNGAHTPTDITVSAWVNTFDGGPFRGLVDKIVSSVGVLLHVNNGVAQLVSGVGGSSNGPSSLNPVNDGTWRLITGTFQTDGGENGTGMGTLYVDGVFQGSLAGNYVGEPNATMNIPGDIPVTSTFAMDGIVDDVALWDNVLTAPQARALFTLADTGPLNYHADFAQQLFDLHDAGSGSAVVNGTTWHFRTDLAGGEGEVIDLGGGNFALQLDASGSGVSTVPGAGLAGDLNGDGFVGQDDLSLVLASWGQNVPPGDPADPSGDQFVGQDDLNPVLGDWGQGTPPAVGGLNAVPEPQSVILTTLGLAGLVVACRRAQCRDRRLNPGGSV